MAEILQRRRTNGGNGVRDRTEGGEMNSKIKDLDKWRKWRKGRNPGRILKR